MEEYKIYQNRKNEVVCAENWLKLKDSRDSQDGKPFFISLAHSNFMLMRCGQHSSGGQNYHESPKEFNFAMLFIIKKHYSVLTQEAINYMKDKEKESLIKCKDLVDTISEEIKVASN